MNKYKLFIDRENVNANNSGVVFEHRDVMSQYLGRPLLPEEIVHHLDCNKSNNDISNLLLLPNASLHTSLHLMMQNYGYTTWCVTCGDHTIHPNCPVCSVECIRRVPDIDELGRLLAKHDNCYTNVANELGVTRQAIYYLVNKYGLTSRELLGNPTELPLPDRSALYQSLLANNGSFTGAGKDFGVTKMVVKKWAAKLNIPDLKPEPDVEELSMMIDEGWSNREMSKTLRVSRGKLRICLWNNNLINVPPRETVMDALALGWSAGRRKLQTTDELLKQWIEFYGIELD